jgi:uncharacterized protein GlcG (DUF336 family)
MAALASGAVYGQVLMERNIVGGLGLSGAPTQEADEKWARAGLAAVASQLK